MDREENRLYIEAIKLAAGSVQYKNISVKDTMIKAVEQLYRYYEITMDEGYLEVVEDIIRKVQNREEGVWYYKCEMTEDMYELVISEQNMFFHDLRRCIFYTFVIQKEKRI